MQLFLSPRRNDSSVAIEQAAHEAGWAVHRLTNWRVPDSFTDDGTGITAYGEPLFVAAIAESLNFALIEPTFSWLPDLPERYVKRKLELTTLQEARKYPTRVFAKPADDKCFSAKVYDSGSSIECKSIYIEKSPAILSEVVDWETEYRFFVLDRTVMCSSLYSCNGEFVRELTVEMTADAKECAKFTQELLDDWSVPLPPALVIDVGFICDRGWAVVEANPAFGAGIYMCAPEKVLPVLARSLVPVKQLTLADERWVLKRTEYS
ncbi:MAG TPA: ATP-grasp domain-containing protein [Drouetiella sp.]